MKILLVGVYQYNDYSYLVAQAYQQAGHEVFTGPYNFYYGNLVPDVLHIQWPESLYKWDFDLSLVAEGLVLLEQRLRWFKERGAIIVHTIHNLVPHEIDDAELERRIFQRVIQAVDILVHHGRRSIDMLVKHYPGALEKHNIICPHGHYLHQYQAIEQASVREYLHIPKDCTVILNFGWQRPYKGGDFIQRVFSQLNYKKKFLLTAGQPLGNTQADCRQIEIACDTIDESAKQLNLLRRINPDEIPYLFNAADLVFLGHRSGLNSGVLAMAASFAKPVVFPDIGNFEEQMRDWVYEKYACQNITDAVAALHRLIDKLGTPMNNQAWLSEHGWDRHVEGILQAVQNPIGLVQ